MISPEEAFEMLKTICPTTAAAIFAVGVSGTETGGWGKTFQRSNNWGMVQLGSKQGAYIEVRDHNWLGKPYWAKLRTYPSPILGAKDFNSVLFGVCQRDKSVLPAANQGNFAAAVRAMAATHYFETRQLADYLTNVFRWAKKAAGERPGIIGMGPILTDGATGPQVDAWNESMGTSGPISGKAVKSYQTKMLIGVDGLIGPQTWAHALMAAKKVTT